MKTQHYLVKAAFAAVFLTTTVKAQTPLGTAFTYQGQLKNGGAPINGTADLQFSLFPTLTGGTQVGSTQSANNVSVNGGLLTAQVDFGAAAFNGDQRFLQIAMRSPAGSGAFTTLTPRQPITGAPYALQTRGVFVDATGKVGIGTTAPLNRLHVASAALGDGIRLTGSPGNDPGFSLFEGTTSRGTLGLAMAAASWSQDAAAGDIVLRSEAGRKLLLQSGPFASGLALSTANNVGIGTPSPQAKLHVLNGDILSGPAGQEWIFHTRSSFGGDFLHITDSDNGVHQFQRGLVIHQSGNVGIGTSAPVAKLHVNGTTRTKILEITGADLAEKFPASERLDPGMVVAIDRAHAGKLCLARGAYNRCVAGVVSGANDFSVGAVLGNLPGQDDAPAVALSGRVYVWCDAGSVAIEPGDLLTTSDTPGHAMKAVDGGRSHGAIIGKAMERIERGKGLILVLVNLQ